MKNKHYFYLLNLLLLITLFGCTQKDIKVNTKLISQLMFKDIESARIDRQTDFQLLKSDEIKLLQECVSKGSNLVELDTNDTPPTISKDYLCITLVKKNRSEADLFYNYEEGYMLVGKIQVNEEKYEEYKNRLDLFKKYLNGLYKFNPSNEIKDLVEKLNEENK